MLFGDANNGISRAFNLQIVMITDEFSWLNIVALAIPFGPIIPMIRHWNNTVDLLMHFVDKFKHVFRKPIRVEHLLWPKSVLLTFPNSIFRSHIFGIAKVPPS